MLKQIIAAMPIYSIAASCGVDEDKSHYEYVSLYGKDNTVAVDTYFAIELLLIYQVQNPLFNPIQIMQIDNDHKLILEFVARDLNYEQYSSAIPYPFTEDMFNLIKYIFDQSLIMDQYPICDSNSIF